MFTLTYRDLNNPNFIAGIRQLGQEKLPLPVSYNLIKIIGRVEKEIKVASELYQKVLKNHAELNEKGEIVFKDNVPGQYIIPEAKQEAFHAELKEWEKISFEVDRHKLPMHALTGAALAPVILEAIMPVIDEELEQPSVGSALQV